MTLLDTERGTLFHVNRTAAAVLATLAAGRDAAEGKNAAVSMLMARYGVSAERAAADIAALLGQLHDRGLLAQPGHGK
ncbi:MAG TPA: PqqD family peptide modification chaperone [Trebonia sp.]|jgi:hypothetical protein|nr:PqqD family peptide modification chaperone [Trebonia sp.]